MAFSRREFLKRLGIGVGGAVVAPHLPVQEPMAELVVEGPPQTLYSGTIVYATGFCMTTRDVIINGQVVPTRDEV